MPRKALRLIPFVVILIGLHSSTLTAAGFFDQEVEKDRAGWFLIDPEELIAPLLAEKTEKTEKKEPPPVRIQINIPERRLYLYEGERLLRKHSVAVGSYRYRTPVGERFLSDITWNPWWFPPPYASWAKGEKPTPPGPGNPLGRVKMSLGGDILLHGTNKEGSVGRPVSHGCMRMKNREAEELAWFFQSRFSPKNDDSLRDQYRRSSRSIFSVKLDHKIPVTIIYDRVAVREQEVEIYPDIYGKGQDIWAELMEDLISSGIPPWEIDPGHFEGIEKSDQEVKISLRELVSPSGL